MILAVAATEFEMSPLRNALGYPPCQTLVCGVGPVESCLQVTRYLEKEKNGISTVINFGVAGVFVNRNNMKQPALLDICIAETEVLGDMGICYPLRIDDLSDQIYSSNYFFLEKRLITSAKRVLQNHGVKSFSGNFVTVNCVSGTERRGEVLRRKYDGLCENMEGAAIARVCEEFSLPFLQVRCISNYVEDRDTKRWKMQQACEKSGHVAALIIEEIGKIYGTV